MITEKTHHDLSRVGATIHKRTCRHYRKAIKRNGSVSHAGPWNWPNQFETLDEAFIATPPWLHACQTCDPFDLEDEA